jgi:hypothetical protein
MPQPAKPIGPTAQSIRRAATCIFPPESSQQVLVAPRENIGQLDSGHKRKGDGPHNWKLGRTKNSRFGLQRLLLVVDENLFVIVCVVSESSTVSRKRPPIDDRLKSGNHDRNVRNFDIQGGFDHQYRVVPAGL